MNCADCEQLFDAYLDGQLAGSLRLEFDAHRLRCRRCQQSLAMLEAIGNVLASDAEVPELSAGFSEQVLQQVQRPRRRPTLRVVVLTGLALQAAAVLVFALLLNTPSPAPTAVNAASPVAGTHGAPIEVLEGQDAARQLLTERFEDLAYECLDAGTNLTKNVKDALRYLNITVPDEYVRQSERIAENPLMELLRVLVPPVESPPQTTQTTDDLHSL